MRLRITVRRHGLPETPIIWNVDLETSTIAQLLEQVNDIIPIESSEWGHDDYAVELKGSNGVNFECLHFQQIGKVFKEDDEVIIRPLLTQDLKIRRVSGRTQITSDGKHLVDGVPFGRPLLRRPDRPPIKIPPRKRRRILYNGDEDEAEDDDEGFLALKEKEEIEGGDSGDDTNNRQLVLHADFEDDDSEEDEDFMPGDDDEIDEDEEADSDEDEFFQNEADEQEALKQCATKPQSGRDEEEQEDDDDDESVLAEAPDDETRAKIRKLHSAFPTAPITVCRDVLDGSGRDVKEAYITMCLGFKPAKPISSFAETYEASLSVPKTRSKKRKAPVEDEETPNSMLVEAADTDDSLLLDYYDQNGLPPGSISSGKALSHMAKALQVSPGKSRPTSHRSNSALSSKSVRFSLDQGLADGLKSTPAIDRETQADESDKDSDGSSSDGTSSSDSSSSDEDSSSSDESKDPAIASETSSSGSDSTDGSISDSSSDDDAPEETSSRAAQAISAKSVSISTGKLASKPVSKAAAPPGQGKKGTHARNQRRRGLNVLNRFKEKGILPAGTTTTEFRQLTEVTSDTSPEDALAAVEAVRDQKSAKANETSSRALEANEEFEARRQELLASLQSGGIEVGPDPPKKSPKKASKITSVRAEEIKDDAGPSQASPIVEGQQDVSNAISTAPETHDPPTKRATQSKDVEENVTPAPFLEAATPQGSVAPLQHGTPSAGAVSEDATPGAFATRANPTAPTSASPNNAFTPRRAKLDLGAGRRMLFGALGLKAPKSKKDEEKVRNELMKDVRPVHTPRAAEETPGDDNEEVEDQDPEAWRDKIVYRAVECCHDDIELSEPPFPFVQRWDPQQQGWPQKGNRGGKRKKNHRDEPQFYQEDRPSKKQKQRQGKHSYAEQLEFLEGSYEPSYQEDSIMESEEPTQQISLPSDDIEGKIDQQLMNDLNEVASAPITQGPEDLAALPDDLATLSNLKDGQAKLGMTIAFKELTMSEDTKWQPEISAYRTAVVNAILDNGELQLTLALRDRLNYEKFYDDETGERIYGRFEMPDEDEDAEEAEDDGIRSLTFSELVEPKIVQDAPADLGADSPEEKRVLPKVSLSAESQNLSNEDEAAGAQFSHVTETTLDSDAPESNAEDSNQESVADLSQPNAENLDLEMEEANDPGRDDPEVALQEAKLQTKIDKSSPAKEQNGSAQSLDKDKAPETIENRNTNGSIISEEAETSALLDEPDLPIAPDARPKIPKIMKDAGWRSSVPSSVIKDLRPTGMESPGDAQVFEKLMKDMTEIESNSTYSPKFHGLDPSSPIKKLRPLSARREPSNSPVRVHSSYQTVDSQAPSSPPLVNDEGESSWLTEHTDGVLSPAVKLTSNQAAEPSKSVKNLDIPRLSKAKAIWAKAQTTARRSSIDSQGSKESQEPAMCLDGTEEKSVEYPKLSVGSSFTSQISDHGRQPDTNFDDSAGLSGDTLKAPTFEDDSFMKQAEDVMTDVEEELPFKKPTPSNRKRLLSDPFLDEEEPEVSHQSGGSRSTKARSSTPDVLRGSPSSDDALPTLEKICSQRETTREQTTPVCTKPTKHTEAKKIQKKARAAVSEDEDEETTPKASRKNFRSSKRDYSLPPVSQVRKSPRQSQARGSQSKALQSCPSQSQPTKSSQFVDLTLSSDVEEDDAVVSEAEPSRRFRKYSLDEEDDDGFEEPGWVQKKSSSQKPIETRGQTSTGLKASSQSSINTSKRKTTTWF